MMKRLIGLVLLITALCICVMASADTSGNCGADGDNVKWTLNDAGDLTISGTGAMQNFTYANTGPWGRDVYTVTIEEGVTTIGDYAFYALSNTKPLTSVTIASSVTSIGACAFYKCESLTSLKIPDNLEKIGKDAFYRCKAVFYAAIGSKGAKTVSKEGRSFYTEGTNLELRYGFDGETETGLEFLGADKEAASVTVPDTVVRIQERAFADHSNLAAVNLPNSLKIIGDSSFKGCTALKSIQLPDSLTTIGEQAFIQSGLTSVTIPSGVTNLGSGLFINCGALTAVTLPAGIQTIPSILFYQCKALKNFTIPATVTEIGAGAFSGSGLTEITIPATVKKLNQSVFQFCADLTSVTLATGIKEIPRYFFSECVKLEEIAFPKGVTGLGEGVFINCTGLKKAVIPDSTVDFGKDIFDGAPNVTVYCTKGSPADLFARENNVKVAYTGNYVAPATGGDVEAGKTKTLSSSFDSQSLGMSWEKPYATSSNEEVVKVTKLTIDSISDQWMPFTITLEGVSPGVAIVRIMVVTSSGDKQIWRKTVIVSGQAADPGTNPDTPGDNPGTNPDNPGDTPGTNPENPGDSSGTVTSGGAVLTVDPVTGSAAVTGADGDATTVTIPDTVNGYPVTGIAPNAFRGKNIQKVQAGNNVRTIGKNAFYGCAKLYAVTLGKNLEEIGDGAFQKCAALKKITIPAKVKKIGKNAFNGCKKLKTITIKTAKLTKKTIGKNSFKGIASKAKFKVPKKKLKDYEIWLRKPGGAPKTVKVTK